MVFQDLVHYIVEPLAISRAGRYAANDLLPGRQYGAQCVAQFLYLIGFEYDPPETVCTEIRHYGVIRISAGHNRLDRRVYREKLL